MEFIKTKKMKNEKTELNYLKKRNNITKKK